MRKYNWVFLTLTFTLFLFFYLFSRQVKFERFKQVNFNMTVRLQDKIPERYGELFEDSGVLVAPLPSVVFVLLITAYGFIIRKGCKRKLSVAIIPLAFVLLVGIEVYGKMKVESPAPPFFMLKNPTTLFPTYHVQEQYSYPSGHSARALFIAISLLISALPVFRKHNKVFLLASILLLSFIIFISIGKIYLGHHWLSDIVGGSILGFATSFMVLTVLADSTLDIRISTIMSLLKRVFQIDSSKE